MNAATEMLTVETATQALIDTLPKRVGELLKLRGQVCCILYAKECKMLKGREQIYKYSTCLLRAGCDYDNLKSVISKRESGELPEENQGLSWGRYVIFPFIISHKDELYFRFFTVPNNPTAVREVYYLRDNKIISKEEMMENCQASEYRERESSLDTITLKISGILEVNSAPV